MPILRPVKRIKVCCLCETWESGGIEAFLSNVIRHMDRTGLEIDIVAANLGTSIFTAPLKECGVRFYQLSGSTRRVAENHKRFRRLLEERQYDVVHLNAYQAFSLGYLGTAQIAGVPMRVAHSHNTRLRKTLTRPLKQGLHRWARGYYQDVMTHRWACSKAAAGFLFGETDSWIFIPNGIDTERFRFNPEVREKVRKDLSLDDKLVIGNVGRLCYQKNQMFLLDVLAEVVRRRPESCLLLVGEGEERARLEKKAKALRLEKSVLFYGTTDKVEQLLWAMDVFAFPSRFEGLGIVAIEAQAAGLRVICSEYVPEEVQATDLVRIAPLSGGPEIWAQMLLQYSTEGRENAQTAVQNAGFSVEDTARKIKKEWAEKAEK